MRIYLAHNYAARDYLLNEVVPLLSDAGHQVTSRWIHNSDNEHLYDRAVEAKMDLDDVDKADAVILFTDQYGNTPGRGKYVELGYMLGSMESKWVNNMFRHVILCGQEQSNTVFYFLPRIRHTKTVEEAIEALNQINQEFDGYYGGRSVELGKKA